MPRTMLIYGNEELRYGEGRLPNKEFVRGWNAYLVGWGEGVGRERTGQCGSTLGRSARRQVGSQARSTPGTARWLVRFKPPAGTHYGVQPPDRCTVERVTKALAGDGRDAEVKQRSKRVHGDPASNPDWQDEGRPENGRLGSFKERGVVCTEVQFVFQTGVLSKFNVQVGQGPAASDCGGSDGQIRYGHAWSGVAAAEVPRWHRPGEV